MYAFAIWDERKKGLFLARDPFGIKPLYLADDGKTLRVASQVKALLAGGRVDTSPEPAGHVGFFLWGHVPSPYTLYRGIRGFPAATTLWLDASGKRPERTFCSIPQILADAEHGLQDRRTTGPQDSRTSIIHHPASAAAPLSTPHSALRTALADTVKHHLIADVPVGVFLSAGLDSTTVAALADRKSTRLNSSHRCIS